MSVFEIGSLGGDAFASFGIRVKPFRNSYRGIACVVDVRAVYGPSFNASGNNNRTRSMEIPLVKSE